MRVAWMRSVKHLGLGMLTAGWFQAAGYSADTDLASVAEQARGSVLLMIACNEAGLEVAHGTGFFVSRDGKLITNRHVVRAGPIAYAKARTGRRYKVTGFLAEDHEHDLVLLQIEGSDFPPLRLSAGRSEESGQPIAVVGNPLGWEGLFSQGQVVSIGEFLGERGWIQIRATLAPGSSGSPVLNARGEVIGVVTALLRDNPGIGLAVPVEVAKGLLAAAGSSARPRPLSSMELRREDDVFMDDDFQRARAASFERNYDEAQRRIESVTRRFPRSEVAYLLRARIAGERGAHDEAVAACRQAIEIRPQYAMAWGELGNAFLRQKNYGEARDAFQRAVSLKPAYSEAWENLGYAWLELGKPGNAADAYTQASRLRPDDDRVWYNLGLSYSRDAKFDHATWAFKMATRANEHRSESWRELGTCYARQGRYPLAADAFERAAQLNPQDAITWYNLGLARSALGQKEKAREALGKLRTLDATKADELEQHLK